MDVSYSEMGTKAMFLEKGGTVTLTKDEESAEPTINLEVGQKGGPSVLVQLTPIEALGLIEYLAVGARPGSGKAFVTTTASEVGPKQLKT